VEITRGKLKVAQRIVIYGPSGIGKSTFASQFPDPVFIDTEGSTAELDVARTPAPSSWAMLLEQVRYIRDNPDTCKTLVIDTADWAERLCVAHVCSERKLASIEDAGYGKGLTYLAEEYGRLLNLLTEVNDRGITIVLTAHSQVKRFEQPNEMGSFDRWELNLEKRNSALIKEWATMVLFANYETFVIKSDNKMEKNKAQGGKRVMYTAYNPCWDAKNRLGLPEKLPFDFAQIAPYIASSATTQPPIASPLAEDVTEEPQPLPETIETTPAEEQVGVVSKSTDAAPPPGWTDVTNVPDDAMPFSDVTTTAPPGDIWDVLKYKPLADLMRSSKITPNEIQEVVGSRGYFPADMPINDYPEEFVSGVLVAAWEQVRTSIEYSPGRLPL
jgi:GTPase SAR1 and related small G proteins